MLPVSPRSPAVLPMPGRPLSGCCQAAVSICSADLGVDGSSSVPDGLTATSGSRRVALGAMLGVLLGPAATAEVIARKRGQGNDRGQDNDRDREQDQRLQAERRGKKKRRKKKRGRGNGGGPTEPPPDGCCGTRSCAPPESGSTRSQCTFAGESRPLPPGDDEPELRQRRRGLPAMHRAGAVRRRRLRTRCPRRQLHPGQRLPGPPRLRVQPGRRNLLRAHLHRQALQLRRLRRNLR